VERQGNEPQRKDCVEKTAMGTQWLNCSTGSEVRLPVNDAEVGPNKNYCG
jgi:hypothetical protein